MFKWSSNKLIIGVVAGLIVAGGAFFLFPDNKQSSPISTGFIPKAVDSNLSNNEAAVEKQPITEEETVAKELQQGISDIQKDYEALQAESKLFDAEMNIDVVMAEADLEMEKIAERRGITKEQLLQEAETELDKQTRGSPEVTLIEAEATRRMEAALERYKKLEAEE